ncbi:alpha/beta hydrolase [Fulvivirga lutimaris]|uniref:alpha/beta hydrolase n=1 Tax=Fulvivirga lutimaris TaxID=1819566 RepID=UPI0012BCF311|nr:dienelactone hydrolase family protein [Fulvivirga lutimaris]MTI38734.1 alpha/beta hydrolase [Fulvivirga lutimaris]
MQEKRINIQFEAHYYQLGELNESTDNLIFVLHGHGQLAKYFINKFKSLDNGKNCIIAPEGLSKYYLEGFSDRVGATWMTKEDRLTDINNYIGYLNYIYDEVKGYIGSKTKVTVIGFSQGSATASRWVADAYMNFDRLILWAGIFPPDMDFNKTSLILKDKPIQYVYGKSDPFITPGRIEEMKELSTKLKLQPDIIQFDGVHDIEEKTLNQLFL